MRLLLLFTCVLSLFSQEAAIKVIDTKDSEAIRKAYFAYKKEEASYKTLKAEIKAKYAQNWADLQFNEDFSAIIPLNLYSTTTIGGTGVWQNPCWSSGIVLTH